MHNKLTQNRRTLIFFMFALLFLFQYLVLGRFTTVRIIQLSLLNIMVFTFIFAFRAYELDTLKSYNAALISYAVGSFIGTLIGMFFIILIFGENRDIYRHEFILTTLYCTAVYPLLSIALYYVIHWRSTFIGHLIRKIRISYIFNIILHCTENFLVKIMISSQKPW